MPYRLVLDHYRQCQSGSFVVRDSRVGQNSCFHSLFEADYERNVGDLIQTRWFYRKTANCTEAMGNTLLYIGSGAASVAAGIKLVGSDYLSNMCLFASTACFAAHITLIGIAKCSAKENTEREGQLFALANEVGFKIVPLKTHVTDVTDDGAH